MRLTVTRTIDAPMDTVWALQLDHEHWPEHLENFTRVVRHDVGGPFRLGSSAAITQSGLGTVDWTVVEFDDTPTRKVFAWTGTARGATYTGRHEVEELIGDRSQLTLSIDMSGPLTRVLGPLMRRRVQQTIDAEAVAFDAWAHAVPATSR